MVIKTLAIKDQPKYCVRIRCTLLEKQRPLVKRKGCIVCPHCEASYGRVAQSEMNYKCGQVLHGGTMARTELCGKRAKFIAPTGMPVCGRHANTVNLFYLRTQRHGEKLLKCSPISEAGDL